MYTKEQSILRLDSRKTNKSEFINITSGECQVVMIEAENSQEGVRRAVGVILMVAITVIIAAVFSAFNFGCSVIAQTLKNFKESLKNSNNTGFDCTLLIE